MTPKVALLKLFGSQRKERMDDRRSRNKEKDRHGLFQRIEAAHAPAGFQMVSIKEEIVRILSKRMAPDQSISDFLKKVLETDQTALVTQVQRLRKLLSLYVPSSDIDRLVDEPESLMAREKPCPGSLVLQRPDVGTAFGDACARHPGPGPKRILDTYD